MRDLYEENTAADKVHTLSLIEGVLRERVLPNSFHIKFKNKEDRAAVKAMFRGRRSLKAQIPNLMNSRSVPYCVRRGLQALALS